jgi:hypothetical protein
MFNSESNNDWEEFLTPEDYDGKIELDELPVLNNHPNGDQETKTQIPEVSDYRRNLVLEFGELLTEPDETPEGQTQRIASEKRYACRTAKRRNGSWTDKRWEQYDSK